MQNRLYHINVNHKHHKNENKNQTNFHFNGIKLHRSTYRLSIWSVRFVDRCKWFDSCPNSNYDGRATWQTNTFVIKNNTYTRPCNPNKMQINWHSRWLFVPSEIIQNIFLFCCIHWPIGQSVHKCYRSLSRLSSIKLLEFGLVWSGKLSKICFRLNFRDFAIRMNWTQVISVFYIGVISTEAENCERLLR